MGGIGQEGDMVDALSICPWEVGSGSWFTLLCTILKNSHQSRTSESSQSDEMWPTESRAGCYGNMHRLFGGGWVPEGLEMRC
jgi:hypothetical protein